MGWDNFMLSLILCSQWNYLLCTKKNPEVEPKRYYWHGYERVKIFGCKSEIPALRKLCFAFLK